MRTDGPPWSAAFNGPLNSTAAGVTQSSRITHTHTHTQKHTSLKPSQSFKHFLCPSEVRACLKARVSIVNLICVKINTQKDVLPLWRCWPWSLHNLTGVFWAETAWAEVDFKLHIPPALITVSGIQGALGKKLKGIGFSSFPRRKFTHNYDPNHTRHHTTKRYSNHHSTDLQLTPKCHEMISIAKWSWNLPTLQKLKWLWLQIKLYPHMNTRKHRRPGCVCVCVCGGGW